MFRRQLGLGLLLVVLLLGVGLLSQEKEVTGHPSATIVIKHQVLKGQSLWSIANRYGVTVAELTRWNSIKDPGKLYIGQTLDVHVPKPEEGESVTKREKELLARVIYAEARGEDFNGQVAVGAVVLNRLRDPKFPKTIREVVYQPGAFTAIADRQIHLEPDETAWLAAEAALNGEDPTGGALFYYNPTIAKDRWIKTRPVLKVIGNHVFSS